MKLPIQPQIVATVVALFVTQMQTVAQEENLGKELGRYFQTLKKRTTQVVATKADRLQDKVQAERLRRAPLPPASPAIPRSVAGEDDETIAPAKPGKLETQSPPPAQLPVGAPGIVNTEVHRVTWVPKAEMTAIMTALRERNWKALLPLLRKRTGYDSVLVVQYEKVSAELLDQEAIADRLKADLERDIAILTVFAEDAPERPGLELRLQGIRQALAECEAKMAARRPEQQRLLQEACRDYLLKHSSSWRVAPDSQ